MNISFYHRSILDFIESLKEHSMSDVSKSLDTLEAFGHMIELPHSKSLGQGLFELRCLSSGIRLFYAFKDNGAVILHIILKKQSRIPKRDLDLARKRKNLL